VERGLNFWPVTRFDLAILATRWPDENYKWHLNWATYLTELNTWLLLYFAGAASATSTDYEDHHQPLLSLSYGKHVHVGDVGGRKNVRNCGWSSGVRAWAGDETFRWQFIYTTASSVKTARNHKRTWREVSDAGSHRTANGGQPLYWPQLPKLFTSSETERERQIGAKAVRTSAIQLQYNCNTRIWIFFLYRSCIALVRTPAIQRCNTSFLQLAENLQATCSSCKKLVLQLYCACADCCNTTKFLCYFIVVAL